METLSLLISFIVYFSYLGKNTIQKQPVFLKDEESMFKKYQKNIS